MITRKHVSFDETVYPLKKKKNYITLEDIMQQEDRAEEVDESKDKEDEPLTTSQSSHPVIQRRKSPQEKGPLDHSTGPD